MARKAWSLGCTPHPRAKGREGIQEKVKGTKSKTLDELESRWEPNMHAIHHKTMSVMAVP